MGIAPGDPTGLKMMFRPSWMKLYGDG